MASRRFAGSQSRSHQIQHDLREERLYFSIEEGDSERLRLLLDTGCNPNHQFDGINQLNKRLLHLTCEKGQEECAKVLLQAGADPNPQDAWWQTPLMNAVCTERDNMVRLMLQNRADPDMTDKYGRSALHIAVLNNTEPSCLDILLEGGADVNVSDERGKNPLYHALMRDGRVDVVRKLLRRNCDVNKRDLCEKRMPLAAAIMHAEEDLVEYVGLLLSAGADPNAFDSFGYTPMTSLIKRGLRQGAMLSESHLKVAELLMSHGHVVNLQQAAKYWFQFTGTALHLACERGCPSLVSFLLRHGANPDLTDEKGMTPLHIAVHKNNTEIVRLLISYNTSLNLLGDIRLRADEWCLLSPLRYALLSDAIDCAQILLVAGCHVTEVDYRWCEQHVPHLLTRPRSPGESSGSSNDTPFALNVPLHAQSSVEQFGIEQGSSLIGATLNTAESQVLEAAHPSREENTRSIRLQPGLSLRFMPRSSSPNLQHANTLPVLPVDQGNLAGFNLQANTIQPSHSLGAGAYSVLLNPNLVSNREVMFDIDLRYTPLQRALFAASSQPQNLFLQCVLTIRARLAQPFRPRLTQLIGNQTVMPPERLSAWVLLNHITGEIEDHKEYMDTS